MCGFVYYDSQPGVKHPLEGTVGGPEQTSNRAELRAVREEIGTRTMPEVVRFYGHWKKCARPLRLVIPPAH